MSPRPPSIDELLARASPLLIAHAGGNLEAPHETLYAYRRAAALGSDVLELDVMLTADDVLVVHHDETVDRLTDGAGAVASMPFRALRALDAAHWFLPGEEPARDRPPDAYPLRGVRTGRRPPPPGSGPEDFRIPSLREVAEALPDLPLDVELKDTGARGARAVDVLAEELEALGRTASTVVAAFDDEVVARIRARLPDVAVSPGVAQVAAWLLEGSELGGARIVQLPPTHDGLDLVARAVDRAHAAGVVVWIWPNDSATQENRAYYQRLLDAGVDGVIAARPSEWPLRAGAP